MQENLIYSIVTLFMMLSVAIMIPVEAYIQDKKFKKTIGKEGGH